MIRSEEAQQDMSQVLLVQQSQDCIDCGRFPVLRTAKSTGILQQRYHHTLREQTW